MPDSISAEELRELLDAGEPVTVVDIRAPSDREWSIPGSLQVDAYGSVGSGNLGALADLDLGSGRVVTVCGLGTTAARATELLRARGVEALTLEGGMRSWSLAWNTAEAQLAGCEVVQVRRTGKGCLSYLVASESEAVVIDASLEPDVYLRLLQERGWRLVAALDTHIHADHISRSRALAKGAGVELRLPAQNRSRHPFRPVAEGGRIPFGSVELTAWHTPGHTPESTCYLLDDDAAFTGDTLFMGSVGRPDLEGGSDVDAASRARLLHGSISRLLQLPASARVLPGHVSEPIPFDGRLLATTIESIRKRVPLVRLDADQFVAKVISRIPPSPPNHSLIVDLNERGEIPADPAELEAGPNRCAIA